MVLEYLLRLPRRQELGRVRFTQAFFHELALREWQPALQDGRLMLGNRHALGGAVGVDVHLDDQVAPLLDVDANGLAVHHDVHRLWVVRRLPADHEATHHRPDRPPNALR